MIAKYTDRLSDTSLDEIYNALDDLEFLSKNTYDNEIETYEQLNSIIDIIEEKLGTLKDVLNYSEPDNSGIVQESLFQEIQSNYRYMRNEFEEIFPNKDLDKCLDKFAHIKGDWVYTDIQYNQDLWEEFLTWCEGSCKVENKGLNEYNMKDLPNDMDLVAALQDVQNGIEDIIIHNEQEWTRIKALLNTLRKDGGYYTELYRDFVQLEKQYGGVSNINYPIVIEYVED